MEIVVVDAETLNPGDLTWDAIAALGNLSVFARTADSELIERCKTSEVILTNKIAFNREVISQLPKLKLICVTATGYNVVDVEAARENNVSVCNVPGYGTDSVAQHTFALILELTNKVGVHSSSVHRGEWSNCLDFSYALGRLIELKGKTLGLIGFGNIGRRTAEIARVFGMEVIYHTPHKKDTDLATHCSVEEVFSKSDFVSLHLPLTAESKEFINTDLIAKMKPTAFLINTARGQLINEQDLADALNSGTIAGAGLDVLSAEPPLLTNPLLSATNCIITPHNAWMSKEARQRIMDITERNIQAFVKGEEVNRVN